MNAVAEAGKREFNIPFYCNVWLAYPPSELPERHIAVAGIGYPSGGPNQGMLKIWKAAAPAIDMIGPDIYSNSANFVLNTFDTYARPDNPLWVPEISQGNEYAPYLFAALGKGAIGFSPFGVDWTGWLPRGSVPRAHAANYALLAPMSRTIAALNYAGKVKTFIEVAGGADQERLFAVSPSKPGERDEDALISPALLGNALVSLSEAGTLSTRAADASGAWVAEARFGFPQRDGEPAPGSANHEGRVLVAQLGPDEFLLTGIGGAVFFHRPGLLPGIRMQILTAEEGYYTPGATPGSPEVWHVIRILNGDQTDRGIAFPDPDARPSRGGAEQPASGDPAPPPSSQAAKAVRIVLGRF